MVKVKETHKALSLYERVQLPSLAMREAIRLDNLWAELDEDEKYELLEAGITPYTLLLKACHFACQSLAARERERRVERKGREAKRRVSQK